MNSSFRSLSILGDASTSKECVQWKTQQRFHVRQPDKETNYERKTDPKSKDDKAEDEKKFGFKDRIFRRLLETQVRRGDCWELTGIFLVRKRIQ